MSLPKNTLKFDFICTTLEKLSIIIDRHDKQNSFQFLRHSTFVYLTTQRCFYKIYKYTFNHKFHIRSMQMRINASSYTILYVQLKNTKFSAQDDDKSALALALYILNFNDGNFLSFAVRISFGWSKENQDSLELKTLKSSN